MSQTLPIYAPRLRDQYERRSTRNDRGGAFGLASNSSDSVEISLTGNSSAAKGEVVVFKIGPDRVPFRVHADLLTHHSEYFRNALRGLWKEAQDRVITIDDVDPSTFELFVYWLYTQVVPTYFEDEWTTLIGTDDYDDQATAWKILLVLSKAYVFGDRFLAQQFRQDTNKELLAVLTAQTMRSAYRWKLVKYAFTHVACDRPILQRVIDDICRYWNPKTDQAEDVKAQKDLPYNFLLRLMKRQAEILPE